MNKLASGFTLIELLITVVIIGILSSIAIPFYQDSMVGTRRARAQAALEAVSAGMERYRVSTDTYVGATASNVPIAAVYNLAADEASTFYDITATGLSATAYSLFATPKSGLSQATDGELTLTSIGVRGWDEDNSGDSYETSW